MRNGRISITLLAAAALAGFHQSVAFAENVPPGISGDKAEVGSIDLPAFTYPPSSLSSEELRRAYAEALKSPGGGNIIIPNNPRIVAMMREHVNAMLDKSVVMVRDRYPVEMSNETIAGIEVIRVQPKGGVPRRNKNRVIINLHGGAFMVGWPSVALLDAIPVAALSGIEVITINYRMYPEAVHPAALQDLSAVYQEILKNHAPRDIGIFGGTAGGVITLQSIPWFREKGLPLPGAIAALACGFQTSVGDSAIWNFNGGFVRPGTRTVAAGGYFGDKDRRDVVPGILPEAFPHYPPTLWLAGTRAPEMSGAITGHARLLKEGVASELYMIEGGWHSSYSTAPEVPESQDAMRYISRWFDTRLGR